MFTNVGGKIQELARVMFIISVVVCVITALVMFLFAADSYYSEKGTYIWRGVAFLVGGPLVSMVEAWFLYGFGLIVESAECNIGVSD